RNICSTNQSSDRGLKKDRRLERQQSQQFEALLHGTLISQR
uniref:MamL-1 domain-containing protein n=1 Tax=Steinernema glaseri TaxID=37863 RepID=A0A1I8AUX7_9BILA